MFGSLPNINTMYSCCIFTYNCMQLLLRSISTVCCSHKCPRIHLWASRLWNRQIPQSLANQLEASKRDDIILISITKFWLWKNLSVICNSWMLVCVTRISRHQHHTHRCKSITDVIDGNLMTTRAETVRKIDTKTP